MEIAQPMIKRRETRKTRRSKKAKQPGYILVAQDMIQRIYDGIYRPGAKVESIRQLAEMYGVGRQVIVSAIDHLAINNYVYSRPYDGIYIDPKVRCGLYYRLGYFANDFNLATGSYALSIIYSELNKSSYQVIPGSNYEAEFTCADWLKRTPGLDGVFLCGEISEKVLAPIVNMRIPYLVLGNYDIAESHPCYSVDIPSLTRAFSDKHFAKFSGQRVTALFGPMTRCADREIALATRAAFRALGIVGSDAELAINCKSGGYEEICALMNAEHPPDVLYIHGIQSVGWGRYCRNNPDKPRPWVILNAGDVRSCSSEFFDEVVSFSLWSDDDWRMAVKQMLEMVDQHETTKSEPK